MRSPDDEKLLQGYVDAMFRAGVKYAELEMDKRRVVEMAAALARCLDSQPKPAAGQESRTKRDELLSECRRRGWL